MRLSLWSVLAVLFVAIGAPCASADSFVYTYTVNLDPSVYGATLTTNPMQAVTTANTILTPVDLASYSLTGSFYLADLDEFILNYGGGGAQAILTSDGLGTASATLSDNDEIPLIDYSTPGTYSTYSNGNLVDTLTVSAVPEPETLELMLIGIGFLPLLATPRRRARGYVGSEDNGTLY